MSLKSELHEHLDAGVARLHREGTLAVSERNRVEDMLLVAKGAVESMLHIEHAEPAKPAKKSAKAAE